MATEKFQRNAENLLETLKYAKEVENVMRGQDMSYFNKVIETVESVYDKALRSQANLRNIETRLDSQKSSIENELQCYYGNITSDTTPTIEKGEEILRELKEELKEHKQELKRIRLKDKEYDCAEREAKLQKQALPVQFDDQSTVDNVKGFIKRDDEKIETFSFDMTKESIVGVANNLWGQPLN